MSAVEIDQSRQWSETNWPFSDGNDSPLVVDYEPREKDLSFRELFIIKRHYLACFAINLCPLHIAVIVWLVANWVSYGDWSFVLDSREVIQGWNAAWMGLLAYAVWVGAIAYMLVWNYFSDKREYLTAIKFWFQKSGCLSIRNGLCTWTLFDDKLMLVEDEREIGWRRTDGVDFSFEKRWIDREALQKVESLLQSALESGSSVATSGG